MKNKIALYTANIGEYDIVHSFMEHDDFIDYYYFRDSQGSYHPDSGWTSIVAQNQGLVPNKWARSLKTRTPDSLMKAYDIVIWVDASFKQTSSLKPLIDYFLEEEKDILSLEHPSRTCTYEESLVVGGIGLSSQEVIIQQMLHYEEEGFPFLHGLSATGLIIRKSNRKIKKFNKDWQFEVLTKSHRDQLSFNYCLWKNKIEYSSVPFYDLEKYFVRTKHEGTKQQFEK